jgi:hypothetical protein
MRSLTIVSSVIRASVGLKTSRYMHALIQVFGYTNYLDLHACKLLEQFKLTISISVWLLSLFYERILRQISISGYLNNFQNKQL